MNLAWWLETGACDFPDKAALIDPDGSEHTYAQLNSLTNRLGNALREKFGVAEDDIVVTLVAENHWHVALMFAVWKIGAVFCPLNRTQTYRKFLHDADITKPKLLVVDEKYIATAKELMADHAIPQAASITERGMGMVSLEEAIAGMSDELRMTPRSHDDLAIINFTTGTTGPSKGAMLPHGRLLTSFLGGKHWGGMRHSARVFCPLYMFHAGGICVTMTTLVAHGTVILMGEPWSSDRCIDMLEKYKPDWIWLIVPVMTRDLNKNPRFHQLKTPGLKIHLAGEPVTPDVQRMWEERGARTLILYGMTESMALGVTLNSFYYQDDEHVGRGLTGRPNKEFCEVKMLDPVTQEEIHEAGIQGEICFKGDVRTPGYYNNPERTAEAIDGDGWFHTFDLGVKDEDGYFTVGGRTDDIISSGGEKLSLIEVETAIMQAPFVKDAACIGVPHERFGHSPAALIVPAMEMSEEELRDKLDAFLRETFDRWRRPRLIVKLDEIPRTLAKRTKIWPRMREIVHGVHLDGDGMITLTEYRRAAKERAEANA